MVQKSLDDIVMEDDVRACIRPLFEQATASGNISFEHDWQWQAYCDLLYAVTDLYKRVFETARVGSIYLKRTEELENYLNKIIPPYTKIVQELTQKVFPDRVREMKEYTEKRKAFLRGISCVFEPPPDLFSFYKRKEKEFIEAKDKNKVSSLQIPLLIPDPWETLDYLKTVLEVFPLLNDDELLFLQIPDDTPLTNQTDTPWFSDPENRAKHYFYRGRFMREFREHKKECIDRLIHTVNLLFSFPEIGERELSILKRFYFLTEDKEGSLHYGFQMRIYTYKYKEDVISFWTEHEESKNICELIEVGVIGIPNYKVLCRIGEGTGRKVYKARCETNGHYYAVKIVKPKEEITGANRRIKVEEYGEGGFAQKEADAGMRLNHKNVIRYFGGSKLGDGRNYVIEQFVDGVTLDDLIKTGYTIKGHEIEILQLDFLDLLFRHVLEGVAYIHDESCVHRDIKPENILVPYSFIKNPSSKLSEDAVRVGDLELVKKVEDGIAHVKSAGARRYTAPEVINEGIVSAAADVFSLGFVLYQIYTGEHLFLGISTKSEEETKKMISERICDPENYAEVYSKILLSEIIPDKYKPIILKCLQYDRVDRYQNAREILAAMNSE